MEIPKEMMDQAIEILGEEEAFNAIETAMSDSDPIACLQKALAQQNGHEETNGFGWTVIKCAYDKDVLDDKTDEWTTVHVDRGYCLRFRGPNITRFCGRSLAEYPRVQNVGDPYDDRQQAEAACIRKAELLEKAPLRSLRKVHVGVLVTTPKLGISPKKIQKQLTQRQQDALSTMSDAYRLADSYGVKNDNDVIAVMLDAVADLMRLPQD